MNKKKSSQDTSKQMTLFSSFKKQWEEIRKVELEGEMYYSILDIFKHFGDSSNPTHAWKLTQERMRKQGFQGSNDMLEHTFEGRGQRKTPVVNEKGFFRIAQSTDFKQWEEIRDFMAQAAKEKRESLTQKKILKTIEYYDSVGWGNRPEILTLKGKYAASQSLIEVKGAISDLVTLTGYEWSDFFSAEIQALLGFAISEVKKARNAKSVRDSLNALEYNALIHAESDLIVLLSLQKTMDSRKLLETVRMVFIPIGKNLQNMLDNIGYNALTGLPLLQSGNN